MLTLAGEGDRERLERFCGDSLLGAYLGCRLRCYGFGYDFVKFWFAEADGEVCALLGMLDSTAVLLAADRADFDELAAFLRMQRFSSVMMPAAIALNCGFAQFTKKTAFVFRGGETVPLAQANADLKEIYSLISREIPGAFSPEKEAYLRFLSDYTFRKKRDCARLAAVSDHGTLCACALTAAESASAAVLSGVATAGFARGKGYGKQVVLSLSNALFAEGKAVYVVALNDSACGFYRALGFREYQDLAYMERNAYV